MKEAKIAEIFLSLQGEGLYVGKEQLFARFYGCNMKCSYCDTDIDSFKTFTRDSFMSKVLEFQEPYHSISLTGGEPLCQATFIKDFLEEYKKYYKKLIYLETNGTLHKELSKVIEYLDIIAMDFKLPSSTGTNEHWKDHEKFLKIARSKEVFVKSVITSNTTKPDILEMGRIIRDTDRNIPVVLQPVTPEGDIKKPNDEQLVEFANIMKLHTSRVEIVPQVHKALGIK